MAATIGTRAGDVTNNDGKRGTPKNLIPFTFDPRNVTSADNRTTVSPDGPCGTLHEMAQAVAFQTRIARNGRGQPKDITDALTSCEGGTHADSKPHVASAGGVRRLTPRECCRLQAFPDDWLDGLGLSDSAKYRMLGNAVCVNVAEWIGRQLMRVVKGDQA